jgi:hypothetical protein
MMLLAKVALAFDGAESNVRDMGVGDFLRPAVSSEGPATGTTPRSNVKQSQRGQHFLI